MVADVKQTADGNYLLAQNFPDCEFKSVLPVYPHRRNAIFIAFQHFVVQRIVTEQVRDGVCGGKQENRLW